MRYGRVRGNDAICVHTHNRGAGVIIYVAGPYTPLNGRTLSDNIEAAKATAKELWSNGFAVICPHMNTAYFTGIPDDLFYLGDMEILERCDAVLMLDGWEESFGAKMERLDALKNNIPVVYSVKGAIAFRDFFGGCKDD